ncbi:unnamed protein product [Adineta steineri]|uniref:Uncharacterized protein n=1 Tax=Adineta steineri TaxID=433720 RepID=A0A813TCN1_9BILA|nr:unnamed protein product [Adineta steineri]CAF0910462.1 unnamed protein product [Adineta steineri]CAF3834130.1 unnamed protein product [Adineta steineri]CAF4130977.1 unnamed protein product [Adineta steineri]
MGAGESSSNNNVTGPVPIRVQNANPLLYTLPQDQMNIQPYWIMILALVVKDIIASRIYYRIRYKTWNSKQEIIVGWFFLKDRIQQFRQIAAVQAIFESYFEGMEKLSEYYFRLKFDIFDTLYYCPPLLGHAIWYCYIQSTCMQAQYATTWNCYNAFGYRLYNYVFVSYCSFFWRSMLKMHVYRTILKQPEMVKDYISRPVEFYSALWASRITIVFVGLLIFPYLFTNVIPMAAAYTFMTFIYIVFCIFGLIFFRTISFIPAFNGPFTSLIKPFGGKFNYITGISIMCTFAALTFPILLSVFYNYSQYVYYDGNYYFTMADEYHSRDTQTYFNIFRASANQVLHTVLNFI